MGVWRLRRNKQLWGVRKGVKVEGIVWVKVKKFQGAWVFWGLSVVFRVWMGFSGRVEVRGQRLGRVGGDCSSGRYFGFLFFSELQFFLLQFCVINFWGFGVLYLRFGRDTCLQVQGWFFVECLYRGFRYTRDVLLFCFLFYVLFWWVTFF